MKRKQPPVLFAAIALLLVAVVAYVIIELNSSVETAPVILPDIAQTQTSPGAEQSAAYAQVTPETVQAVIGTLRRPEGYTRTVTVEDFWGEDSSHAMDLTVQVSGNNSRITALTTGGLKYILVSPSGTWIWYEGEKDVFRAPPKAAYDGDQWLRSLTYEELMELSPEEITAAGYEEHNGVWCVYASYRTPRFDYDTTVWVSVTDGLLSAAEIYDGDAIIYRMTAGATDLTVPDDSVFLPPDGDAPHTA